MWELIITISLILGAIIAIREHYINQPVRCSSNVLLRGKTAIVTGASSGVGRETAQALAERGARVIIASEDMKKAQNIAVKIINSTGNKEICVRHLNTADFRSVREFAKDILKTENELHILVNAATIRSPRQKMLTSDGLEVTMATNHLGHFLATNMLLGLLKASAPSRIVNLTSEGHRFCKDIDPEDLNYKTRPFKGSFAGYGQSKLCINLFTSELSRKLQNSGVTVNCVHPGTAESEIYTRAVRKNLHSLAAELSLSICKYEKLESRVVDYLVVSEEIEKVSGKYFVSFEVSEPSWLSRDQVLAQKIWDASEKLVKLSPHEKHY